MFQGVQNVLNKQKYVIILFILMAIILLLSGNVNGEGDFEVSHSFSSNPAKQGETETITISITNNNADQCKIYWLGIHFDWQSENIYSMCTGVSEENPESIATGENENFYIIFEIPSNVQTGTQVYDIRFEYELHDGWFGEWNDYTWQSTKSTDFRVIEKEKDDGGGGGSSSDKSADILGGIELLLILGIIMILIILILIAWVMNKRKKRQAEQYPQQQYPSRQSPQPPYSQHYDGARHSTPPPRQPPQREYYPEHRPTPPLSSPSKQQHIPPSNESVTWEEEKIPKFCPSCGKPTRGKGFCAECGEKLN